MTRDQFVCKVLGAPWMNRSCNFEAMDCWALVVLYYRHVLGIEIHHTPDYEAGADFVTCFAGDVVFWRQVENPVNDGIFVGYKGSQPAHVGLIVNRQALHSRGEGGGVRMDTVMIIERAFTEVRYYVYGKD
ncbi:NlpC/P60 family protein [Serratia fonticola]|uniref:NlpC/P60 family protein n=1 Tax=Serratia fonticola TaxID=47917 RepID=UPI003AAE3BB3